MVCSGSQCNLDSNNLHFIGIRKRKEFYVQYKLSSTFVSSLFKKKTAVLRSS